MHDVNVSCFGTTKCHLVTRVREHSNSASAVLEHMNGCHACRSAKVKIVIRFRIREE